MNQHAATSRYVPLPAGRGRYFDTDGREREIAVDVDRGGAFRVIDMGVDATYLVERLGGFDDDQHLALAVAEDYRVQIDAYLAGERDDMPFAHPLGGSPTALPEYAPRPASAAKTRSPTNRRRATGRRARKPPAQQSIPLDLAA